MSALMNRRTVLAGGAAILPAIALPAAVLATSAPSPDAVLLALGERMKSELPGLYEAMRLSHRLRKQVDRAIGEPADNPDEDFREYGRRFHAACAKCGADVAYDRWNELGESLRVHVEAALALPAHTLPGAAVKAMAELAMGDGLGNGVNRSDDPVLSRLWEIASLAGFPVPSWVGRGGKL